MILGAVITVLGTAGLLASEARGNRKARVVFKPVASAGFVVAALGVSVVLPTDPYAVLFLAGLVLSVLGDVFLLGERRQAFLAGMAVFALAHAAYITAFLTVIPLEGWLVASGAVFLAIGHLVWRQLEPRVTAGLRLPVRIYVLIVSLMAACAGAALASGGRDSAGVSSLVLPATGGLAFYVSDIAVARNRFVRAAFANKLWGLPLYYAGQLAIASAVWSAARA